MPNNFQQRETQAEILLRSQGTDYEAHLISDLWIQCSLFDHLWSFIKTMSPSLLVFSSLNSRHMFTRKCIVTAMRN